MNITLESITAARENWSLSATGVFDEGIHLVSGDVGSGKTTLALAMSGLLPLSSGGVVTAGIRTRMLAFQFPEYHITGMDLESECRTWNLEPSEILPAAGLGRHAKQNPLRLSRGELKRLVLTCILAKEYDLLILDEPFSSLDCAGKERLCSALSGRMKGITVIFTHEQAFFPRVDRIWEIHEGTLYDRGRPPAALHRWEHAPVLIKDLIAAGRIPENISQKDLLEAACRTSD